MLTKIPPVPLLLSGYCPYLPSIHPGSPLRNAFNNTVSHVSLEKGCLEWLVWFAISNFPILWGLMQTLSLMLSWQVTETLPNHYGERPSRYNLPERSQDGHSLSKHFHYYGKESLGLLSLLFCGSWVETGSYGSQAPSQEVVPSDLLATHILPYQRSLRSLLSLLLPLCSSVFSSLC